MAESTSGMGRTAFSITINIIAAVSVILVNKKAVFGVANFHFGTALTIMHFVWTSLLCSSLCYLGFFEHKVLSFREIVKMSAVFSSYLMFQNLSLVYNSVGFYQIMKIANTPAILLMEYLLYGKRQHPRVLWSLLIVCLGIGAAVFTEPKLNLVGSIHALLAVMFNSLYTIWGKHKQDEMQCNAAQLLLYQAPTAAAFLLFPLTLDNLNEFLSYQYTTIGMVCIGGSCLLAGVVNLSFFWMVARTSPITANVIGYVKTVFVFLGGFLLFADELTTQNVIGITITLLGSAVFMWAQLQEPAKPPVEARSPKVVLEVEDPSSKVPSEILKGTPHGLAPLHASLPRANSSMAAS